jgi:hypothetical protein
MEYLVSHKSAFKLFILGIYQLIGGLMGTAIESLSLYSYIRNDLFTALTGLQHIVFMLFFCYSVYCGICCIQIKKNALKLSLINQYLQLIGFSIMGLMVKYVSGLEFTIYLRLNNPGDISLGSGFSKFDFYFVSSKIFAINLNLVALLLKFWIKKLDKKINKEAPSLLINSIGKISV